MAVHALSVGARVFIEWPRGCAYWKDSQVAKFLAEHKFAFAEFDGCMYGLTAASGGAAGMPIRKPWKVACSPGSSLPRRLCKKCDGSHNHVRCEGQNTLLTQGYTPEIVKVVHQTIVADIAAANGKTAKRDDKGGVENGSVVSYAGRSIVSVEIDEMDELTAVAVLAEQDAAEGVGEAAEC